MGGSATPVKKAIGKQAQAVIDWLPQLSQLINTQILPSEQARLAAAQTISPQTAALQTQLYGQYAPELNRIGSQIDRQNALAESATNVDVMRGPGMELLRSTRDAERYLDPEFYATRENASRALNDRLSGGLSGGERAEVERSLGQSQTATGNLGLDNATNAVSNAMKYGDRMAGKRQELNQYVNSGLNASQGGVNSAGIALGGTQAPQTNFGTSQFQSPGAATGASATLGTSLLGNMSQIGAASINPQAEASWKSSDRYAMDQIGANS